MAYKVIEYASMKIEDEKPEFKGDPSPVTELTLRLRQRIKKEGYPPILFDLLAPSREGAFESLYDPLQMIVEIPPAAYPSIYIDGGVTVLDNVLPNVMGPGDVSPTDRNIFIELTPQGEFRTYSVISHTDSQGRYELRGIHPLMFPANTDLPLVEAQANAFLERIPQLLSRGVFQQPIEVNGRNAALPQDPELVLL